MKTELIKNQIGNDHIVAVPMYGNSLEFRKEATAGFQKVKGIEYSENGELRVYHVSNGRFNLCIYKKQSLEDFGEGKKENLHASIEITKDDLLEMLALIAKKDDEINSSLHQRLINEMIK